MTFSSGPAADHRMTRETSWLTCLSGPTSTSSATRPRSCCAPPSAVTLKRSRASARSPGRLPLHTAAGNGRAASVRRLLAHGANPNLRDPRHRRTPLEDCQEGGSPGHREVEAILRPLTQDHAQPPGS
jgi:hypothetical protein